MPKYIDVSTRTVATTSQPSNGSPTLNETTNIVVKDIKVSGDAYVKTSLDVSGGTLVRDISVLGYGLFKSAVDVSGALVVKNMSVLGNGIFKSAVDISGGLVVRDVSVLGDGLFKSAVDISGGLVVRDMSILGNGYFKSGVDISGALVAKDVFVNGVSNFKNTNITGLLGAESANFKGGVDVSGGVLVRDIIANGNGLFRGSVSILGPTSVSSFNVSGSCTVAGINAYALNTIFFTATGISSFKSNVDVIGTLDVSGVMTAKNINVANCDMSSCHISKIYERAFTYPLDTPTYTYDFSTATSSTCICNISSMTSNINIILTNIPTDVSKIYTVSFLFRQANTCFYIAGVRATDTTGTYLCGTSTTFQSPMFNGSTPSLSSTSTTVIIQSFSIPSFNISENGSMVYKRPVLSSVNSHF